MSDFERVRIATSLALLIGIALSIGYAIYPYLYSLFYPLATTEDRIPEGFTIESTASGRVLKHVGIVKVGKDPDDDPWAAYADRMFVNGDPAAHGSLDLTSVSSFTISTQKTYHPTLNIVNSTRIVASFSFNTQTTASPNLRIWTGTQFLEVMFIPSRTFYPGYIYRWTITIPSYDSTAVKVSPIVSGRSGNTHVLYRTAPLTCQCLYWSGGQGVYGTTTFSITENRINTTHFLYSITITFSNEWVGRQVSSCILFTSDSSVISTSNADATNRQISGSLYIMIAEFSPNIVIEQGDMIQVTVYYVAPSNI